MNRFDELKQKFPNVIPVAELRANVSIIELAVHYGYHYLPHKGQSRPVLRHPDHDDTIVIKNPNDASQQLYQQVGNFSDSGTIIDFVRHRLATVFSVFNQPSQHEFRNVTNVLYDYLKIDPDQVARNRKVVVTAADPNPKQSFAKELFDIRPLEQDHYLLKRHIDPRTIESAEFKGKAVTLVTYLNTETKRTEDFLTAKAHPERNYLQFHNVAFPYYNGLTAEVMGFEVRNDHLKQHAPGSDRYGSVFISNIPPKIERFVVLESVLDAMAHKQLRSLRGDDAFNTVYFSTGGQLTAEQINTLSRYVSSLEKSPNWKIELAFDNDAKGHRYDLQFVQQLTAPQFPIASTVATANRLGLLLPETAAHRPLLQALLNRVELFNTYVRSQIEPVSTGDEMAKKEMSGQLITIGQVEKQTVLYIPQTISALSTLSNSLLEFTGLSNRIGVAKSGNKDYCDELKMHLDTAKRFTYGVLDESGQILFNSNSAVTTQRMLIFLQHHHTVEGQNVTFKAIKRQMDGWQKEQALLEIKNGAVHQATEQADFRKQVLVEKSERSQKEGAKAQVDRPEEKKHKSPSTPLKMKPQ